MRLYLGIMGLLIPATLLVFGFLLRYRTPTNRLGSYGYRTARSRRTQEAWEFSNKLAGKYWLWEGAVLLPVSALLLFLFSTRMAQQAYYVAYSILLGVQILGMCLPLPFVERALKDKFEA